MLKTSQTYVIGKAEIDSFDILNLFEDEDVIIGITELESIEGRSLRLRSGGIRPSSRLVANMSRTLAVDDQLTEDIFGRSRVTATMILGIIRDLSGSINGSSTINPVPINSMLAYAEGDSSLEGSLSRDMHDPIEWDDILELTALFPESPVDGQVFTTTLISESDSSGTKSRPSSWVYNAEVGQWLNRSGTVIGSHRVFASTITNQEVALGGTLSGEATARFRDLASRYVDQGLVTGTANIIYTEGRFISFKTFSSRAGEIDVSLTGSSMVSSAEINTDFALGGGSGRDLSTLVYTAPITFEVTGSSVVVADLLDSTNHVDGRTTITGVLNSSTHHPLAAVVTHKSKAVATLKLDWEIDGVVGEAVIRQTEQPIITAVPVERYSDGLFVPNLAGTQYDSDGEPLLPQQFHYEISAVDVFNNLPILQAHVLGKSNIERPDPLMPESDRLTSEDRVDERELFVDYLFNKDAGRANGKTTIESVDMGISTTRYHQDVDDVVTIEHVDNVEDAAGLSRPSSPSLGDVFIVVADDIEEVVISEMWNGTEWVSNAPDGTYYYDEDPLDGDEGEGGRYR
jgi:hypothetical protein